MSKTEERTKKQLEVFKEQIAEHILEYLPEKYQNKTPQFQQYLKGITKLTGFKMVGQGSYSTPILYLDYYVNSFIHDPEKTLRKLAEQYIMADEANPYGNMQDIKDALKKENVILEVMKRPENEEVLKDILHVDIMDMVGVFRCILTSKEEGRATIHLTNADLTLLGIDNVDDLFEQAKKNIQETNPPLVRTMQQTLIDRGMLSEDMADVIMPVDTDDPVYCITNRDSMYGANAFFFIEYFKELADKLESDLMILPSSVHELLCLKKTSDNKLKSLRRMVKSINSTQDAKEELLSDSVYAYSRETNQIYITK